MNFKKEVKYPPLNSVLIVEELISQTSGNYSKNELWEQLNDKLPYNTFSLILDYLIKTEKISIDNEEKICRIWTSD